eukprot:s1355_g15.t1
MFELLQRDEFFVSQGAVEQSSVQRLSHMNFFRTTGALFGTAEAAEAAFSTHAEAIRTMTMIATAVQTSAQELFASIKAISKAKDMEQKEQAKEEKRRADAEARKAKAEAKKRAQKAEKERLAAEQKQQQQETAQGKKHRNPTKIAQEMTDTDPDAAFQAFENMVEVPDGLNNFGVGCVLKGDVLILPPAVALVEKSLNEHTIGMREELQESDAESNAPAEPMGTGSMVGNLFAESDAEAEQSHEQKLAPAAENQEPSHETTPDVQADNAQTAAPMEVETKPEQKPQDTKEIPDVQRDDKHAEATAPMEVEQSAQQTAHVQTPAGSNEIQEEAPKTEDIAIDAGMNAEPKETTKDTDTTSNKKRSNEEIKPDEAQEETSKTEAMTIDGGIGVAPKEGTQDTVTTSTVKPKSFNDDINQTEIQEEPSKTEEMTIDTGMDVEHNQETKDMDTTSTRNQEMSDEQSKQDGHDEPMTHESTGIAPLQPHNHEQCLESMRSEISALGGQDASLEDALGEVMIREYGPMTDLAAASSQATTLAVSTTIPEGHLTCPDETMAEVKPKRATKAAKEVKASFEQSFNMAPKAPLKSEKAVIKSILKPVANTAAGAADSRANKRQSESKKAVADVPAQPKPNPKGRKDAEKTSKAKGKAAASAAKEKKSKKK